MELTSTSQGVDLIPGQAKRLYLNWPDCWWPLHLHTWPPWAIESTEARQTPSLPARCWGLVRIGWKLSVTLEDPKLLEGWETWNFHREAHSFGITEWLCSKVWHPIAWLQISDLPLTGHATLTSLSLCKMEVITIQFACGCKECKAQLKRRQYPIYFHFWLVSAS